MICFLGVSEQKIDVKRRISVPADFRDMLGEKFAMIPGPEGGIYCYPMEIWEEKVEAVLKNGNTREGRRAQTRLFSMAVIGSVDKSGRVTLPEALCEKSHLESDIVVAGAGTRIELWNRDEFNSYMDEEEKNPFDYKEDINF